MNWRNEHDRKKFLKSIIGVFVRTNDFSPRFQKDNYYESSGEMDKKCRGIYIVGKYGERMFIDVFTNDFVVYRPNLIYFELVFDHENKLSKREQVSILRERIDLVLDMGDKERFMELTEQLKELEEKGMQLT